MSFRLSVDSPRSGFMHSPTLESSRSSHQRAIREARLLSVCVMIVCMLQWHFRARCSRPSSIARRRQVDGRERVAAALTAIKVRHDNSKAFRRTPHPELLELPVERLHGPDGCPSSCCLLCDRDGALDWSACSCSPMDVLSSPSGLCSTRSMDQKVASDAVAARVLQLAR